MKFFNTIAALLLTAAGLSEASPLQARQAPAQFQLKTKVIAGTKDTGSKKDGLYIFSYHTGAGQGMAAAENQTSTSYFYLNQTTLLWSYPDNEIGPWKTIIEYGAYQCKIVFSLAIRYANLTTAYNEISISIATDEPATPGFSLNSDNTLNSTASEGGWLVCDSWYQSPQLFALNGLDNGKLPSSCSRVELVSVAAAAT